VSAYLSQILKKHKVILVTTFLDPDEEAQCKMIPAGSLDEPGYAYGMNGEDASVVVIPDG
jgi:nickel-dependent lactate racemase